MTHENDVQWLLGELPDVRKVYKIKGYHHFDFVIGLNAYEKVLQFLTNLFNNHSDSIKQQNLELMLKLLSSKPSFFSFLLILKVNGFLHY